MHQGPTVSGGDGAVHIICGGRVEDHRCRREYRSGLGVQPSIELIVFDELDDVPLGEDTAYPDGTYELNFSRDAAAPFELVAFVDDEPERIRWLITVNDYLGEVVQQGLGLSTPVLQTAQSSE